MFGKVYKASGSRAEIIELDLSNGKQSKTQLKSCMRERKKLIF